MLRRFISAISLIVFTYDFFKRLCKKLIGKNNPGKCVILYYHAIIEAKRNQFSRQIALLAKIAHPIKINNKEPLKDNNLYAGITFDDGFVSVMDNGLPVLFEHNIPCTIFITTGYMGMPPLWIKKAEHPFLAEKIVDEKQLIKMSKSNLVTIGAHCVNHPDLLSLNLEHARKEMVDSKETLEKIMGYAIELFSFPHGSFNPPLVNLARECGFSRVFTINPGLAFNTPDEFITDRVHADPGESLLEIRLKLAGAYRWLPKAYAFKKWIKSKVVAKKSIKY